MSSVDFDFFTFADTLKCSEIELTEQQKLILKKFGITNNSRFEFELPKDKPGELKPLNKPWKPSNEGIIESYLLEVHSMKVNSGAAASLQASANKLANNKSLEELGYDLNASMSALAFSNKGATRNKTAAATKQAERLQKASMISAEANAKKQEWIQWSQFALTQEDFKEYKQTKICNWETECKKREEEYDLQNQNLIAATKSYESAVLQIKTAKIEEVWNQIDTWLNSEKYQLALQYEKEFLGPLNIFMMGLGILAVLMTAGLLVVVMLPIHFFYFKDYNVARALYSIKTGIPRFPSLRKGLPVVGKLSQ